MPDGIGIKVDGLQQVQKDLYRYSQQLGDRVTRTAMREGAKVTLKEARRLAPRRAGKLRRNITIKNSRIHNGRRSKNTIGVYIAIRKKAFYGRFLNDGYKSRGGRNISGMNFMGDALSSTRSKAASVAIQASYKGAEIVKRKTRTLR